MTPDGKPGMRRYGQWAGSPRGQPEDVTRCVESVYPTWTRAPIPGQCARKRGHGPGGEYCKQHAKRYPQEIANE
jgi:hypothetical protein